MDVRKDVDDLFCVFIWPWLHIRMVKRMKLYCNELEGTRSCMDIKFQGCVAWYLQPLKVSEMNTQMY